ncbi:MAG: ABC transporter ATP-binding protein [Bacteroidales bacterium]|nr:ABC transporter ATP-binding protein [Bacteroidales bacterium]
MALIEVTHLNKAYGKVKALQDVSFDVHESEVFGVVGPDGAGKSTLFNILTTLLLPDSGNATVLHHDVRTDYLEIRKHIGYLPGTFSLYPDLSVEENLVFFATMYQSDIEKNMPLILPIWQQLLPFKKRPAGKLSGGMKQKLALCCALIHKPTLLFLDEPTTGVDPVSRKEFWEILRSIKQQGITVVVSTPYMDEATLCDRIALLQNGQFIKMDTPQAIISDFRGTLVSLRTPDIFRLHKLLSNAPFRCTYYPYGEHMHIILEQPLEELLPQLKQFLDQHQIQFSHIQQITPSVEDCFIEIVKNSHAQNH